MIKKINKNLISYLTTTAVLIAEMLAEHATLILNIDLKYYLFVVLFINLIISYKKHMNKKNKASKSQNKGDKTCS